MALARILAFLTFFSFFQLFGAQSQPVEFIYNRFSDSNLILEGASVIKPTGELRLTNHTSNIVGQAFYPQRIQLVDRNSSLSGNISSFSTYFVFAIRATGSGQGGYGLAFALTPTTKLPSGATEHYLGLFNSSNDGNATNHIFAVEFDTVNGHNEFSNSRGNHVGINVNGVFSKKSEPAAYYPNGTDNKEEVFMESSYPVQAWIDYDGKNRVVNVTISPLKVGKPEKPLMTYPIDLTPYLKESMYVGFSASTGKEASAHYILGWSFSMNGSAPPLDLSQLSIPPLEEMSSSSHKNILRILLPCLAAGILLFCGLILAYFKLYKKLGQHEILEDWEMDCPHRFRYKDLHTATKGFKESELIGVGGFGTVYRGVVPSTGCEIAVKKITRNSVQGMREFAAEIESLGRLRHKNLVHLQGWCKKRNHLLLVYDYIPNGSLDFLLFHPEDTGVLSWEHRFHIIKGVAAGLLYLHEEWEQLVVHRDVKSSNVLIDADMNARLGDFGLARLYDHGGISHTTSVVGTIGYIAPELARTGKPTANSDVFAYGILLLEVACGRRPVGSNHFILVDWVLECYQTRRLLDVVDPNLNSEYIVEEMVLVLQLGMLCSHQKQEARPTMRQVTRYLNGDDPLPTIDISEVQTFNPTLYMDSRSFNAVPFNTESTSFSISSNGFMTSDSADAGR